MTPPAVPKVCLVCRKFPIPLIEGGCDPEMDQCAALELLRELVRTGELPERLRKEVE